MIDEDEMKEIMESEEETKRRVYEFPRSQILLDGKKSSYFEVISSLRFDEINEALKRIYKKIEIEKLYEIIDGIEIISNIHKDFYKHMLKARYEMIIKYSYEKLRKTENKEK
ncbi:MAG: hypothetical protein MJ246_09045 [Clostridia bacterium]|nr:hypothetical protein [Clostridia bacterium]